MGTWGGERLRRKGVLRARIEALLAVWGQTSQGGDERVLTSESLGVKEQRVAGLRAISHYPFCVGRIEPAHGGTRVVMTVTQFARMSQASLKVPGRWQRRNRFQGLVDWQG